MCYQARVILVHYVFENTKNWMCWTHKARCATRRGQQPNGLSINPTRCNEHWLSKDFKRDLSALLFTSPMDDFNNTVVCSSFLYCISVSFSCFLPINWVEVKKTGKSIIKKAKAQLHKLAFWWQPQKWKRVVKIVQIGENTIKYLLNLETQQGSKCWKGTMKNSVQSHLL